MDYFKKDNVILKIISIIGVSFNTVFLLAILILEMNLFTFILISLCLLGIYYPIFKKNRAYKLLENIENTKNDETQLVNAGQKSDIDIDLFSKIKGDIFDNIDSEMNKENDINLEIIDGLRLENIKLNNKIKEINSIHGEKIRALEKEKELYIEQVKSHYEDKINSLEKQIEDMSVLTDEKRNELKEEALYEYLTLIKEDYHEKLNGDKYDNKDKSVYTYVAGVKYTNPYGENRQKLIREYVKEHHDINLFDKYDYNYVSNKEIEEESGYGFRKKYYKYELEEFDTIRLVKEPDNPYDENAIAIIHEEMGHIGYIPREDIDKVKILLDKNEKLEYRLKFYGGRYKYFDEYECKVKSASTTYSFKLSIECV